MNLSEKSIIDINVKAVNEDFMISPFVNPNIPIKLTAKELSSTSPFLRPMIEVIVSTLSKTKNNIIPNSKILLIFFSLVLFILISTLP